MKCIAFSDKSIHGIENQINYFLKENENSVEIISIAISVGENIAAAVVTYIGEVV